MYTVDGQLDENRVDYKRQIAFFTSNEKKRKIFRLVKDAIDP
jgi:hypothetical protein